MNNVRYSFSVSQHPLLQLLTGSVQGGAGNSVIQPSAKCTDVLALDRPICFDEYAPHRFLGQWSRTQNRQRRTEGPLFVCSCGQTSSWNIFISPALTFFIKSNSSVLSMTCRSQSGY
ncbi:hypothetical protein [Aneurinibacillus migulanus]|uniref:hypothetical protein n=1 Tax=Aneurinibacillus migulanus TaxID=47500 RepID=UPI00128F4FED|nr:hypothetical protein [Aneurinibacillus migulanus]